MTTEMTNAVTTPQAEQKKPATHDRPKMKRSDRMLLKLILIGLLSVILLIPQQLILHSDGSQTMKEYAKDLGISEYTILWYTTDGKHNKYTVTVKAE